MYVCTYAKYVMCICYGMSVRMYVMSAFMSVCYVCYACMYARGASLDGRDVCMYLAHLCMRECYVCRLRYVCVYVIYALLYYSVLYVCMSEVCVCTYVRMSFMQS